MKLIGLKSTSVTIGTTTGFRELPITISLLSTQDGGSVFMDFISKFYALFQDHLLASDIEITSSSSVPTNKKPGKRVILKTNSTTDAARQGINAVCRRGLAMNFWLEPLLS